jgi:hypothetical protein
MRREDRNGGLGMAKKAAEKQSAHGLNQYPALVAGKQDYEVGYEAKKPASRPAQ